MIAQAAAIPYAARFRREIATAGGTFQVRRGWWLLVRDAAGIVGLGEIAPLPSFGTETHEEAGRRIERLLEEPAAEERRFDLDAGRAPAFAAGFSLALADRSAKAAGVRLAESLTPRPRGSVPCHRLLRETDRDALAAEAAAAAGEGYRAVKIKIGLHPLPVDLGRVAAVREAVGPRVRIRLDANGADDPATALDLLRRLEPLRPEYVEQPVARGIASLRGRTGVAVAADEEAATRAKAYDLIRARAADVVILRLSCVGGIAALADLARMAGDNGIGVVPASSFETPVGLAGALHAAASLPVAATCGLATADLLEPTPLRGLGPPAGGRIALPRGPGHGVVLEQEVEEGRWR